MRHLLFAMGLILLIGCSSTRKTAGIPTSGDIKEIRFINQYIIPNDLKFKNTVIGGLSGIDYNKKRDEYYLICDDPSTQGPARFYTFKMFIGINGEINNIFFNNVTIILDPSGNPYTDITKDRFHSADLEAMRYDPVKKIFVRSSEGQRFIRDGKQELQNPDIVIMNREGRYKGCFELPGNMQMQPEQKGPRHNGVFEGLTFDDHGNLFVSVEDAIYEDGPAAATGDSTAWTRLLKFDRKTKKQVAQYAYQVDAVPHAPVPSGASKINGVSDILYAGDDKFIVVERAYSTGRDTSDVRVYLADVKNAEDISGKKLSTDKVQRPVIKKLLLDMNKLGIFIDNIEGVTFGPVLSNGHRSLIFVADNNFSARQRSQFLVFEVFPD